MLSTALPVMRARTAALRAELARARVLEGAQVQYVETGQTIFLQDDPADPRLIITIHGAGYLFSAPVSSRA